jgi:hypothetical protein
MWGRAVDPENMPVDGAYAWYQFPNGCSKCRFPYIEGAYHKCIHDIPMKYWAKCERCGESMAPWLYHVCRQQIVEYPEWLAGWRERDV